MAINAIPVEVVANQDHKEQRRVRVLVLPVLHVRLHLRRDLFP